MKNVLVLVMLLNIAWSAHGQSWKRMRHELSGGIGISNFLGDLGGSEEGGGYGPQDYNWAATRWYLNGSYRYYVRQNMALKGSLTVGMLSGDDAHSTNEFRQQRSLKFRSLIVEVSGQYEFYFMTHRTKGTYRLRGAKGLKKLKLDGYLFVGIGMFYFNPKGEYNGDWYALQPLGTEGQGIAEGRADPYSRIQACFPFGVGFKRKINKKVAVGFEMGLRFTTTDYVDDVSDVYYESDLIAAAHPDLDVQVGDVTENIAGYLSNPGAPEWADVAYNADGTVSEYQKRGNPHNNDTYMFVGFSVHYKLIKQRRSLPKF